MLAIIDIIAIYSYL